MSTTTVIYHSGDFDGIFCREIAKKSLGEKDVEYIGWNFGDEPLPVPLNGKVIIMDLPVDRPLGFVINEPRSCIEKFGTVDRIKDFNSRLVWIDHHKSSIETHPAEIPGYRIDGVAACRLAWQWFNRVPYPAFDKAFCDLPDNKEVFINRDVREPLAVRLAGEYDIWDKRDPNAETLQYALRCRELTAFDWNDLLSVRKLSVSEIEGLIAVGHDHELLEPDGSSPPMTLIGLLEVGKTAQAYAQHTDASICNSLTWIMEWAGLKFLCVNHARFNSLLFAAKDVPETGHDALLGFRFDGKQWMVSLYHAKHRTDIDLSQIAVLYGGGGHRGACGFTCKTLPFPL